MTQHLLDHASWEEPVWEQPPPGPRRWPWVVLGAVLVSGVLYAGAAWWTGGHVPRGTTVAGVAVGGQDVATARATLERRIGSGTDQPLTLTSSAGRAAVAPARAGLRVDVPATVAGLTGFTLDPTRRVAPRRGRHRPPGRRRRRRARPSPRPSRRPARGWTPNRPRARSRSPAARSPTARRCAGTTTDAAGTLAAVRRWWPGAGHRRGGRRPRGPPRGRRRARAGAGRLREGGGVGPGHRRGRRPPLRARPRGLRHGGRAHALAGRHHHPSGRRRRPAGPRPRCGDQGLGRGGGQGRAG